MIDVGLAAVDYGGTRKSAPDTSSGDRLISRQLDEFNGYLTKNATRFSVRTTSPILSSSMPSTTRNPASPYSTLVSSSPSSRP